MHCEAHICMDIHYVHSYDLCSVGISVQFMLAIQEVVLFMTRHKQKRSRKSFYLEDHKYALCWTELTLRNQCYIKIERHCVAPLVYDRTSTSESFSSNTSYILQVWTHSKPGTNWYPLTHWPHIESIKATSNWVHRTPLNQTHTHVRNVVYVCDIRTEFIFVSEDLTRIQRSKHRVAIHWVKIFELWKDETEGSNAYAGGSRRKYLSRSNC